MKSLAVLIFLLSALPVFGQQDKAPVKSVTWKIDNLKKIGGQAVEVLGDPKIVSTDRGNALVFDGARDGIFIKNGPIAGAEAFTIEAIFRPDSGGGKEQRWLHIEDTDNVETRALLEIRLDGSEWFLDTFIKSGDNRSALYAENFKHPVGPWYHVALVYDGKEMRHYVNGKIEMSGAVTAKAFGKSVTSIGVRQNKVYWFKGAMLKARFTGRALSPGQFMK